MIDTIGVGRALRLMHPAQSRERWTVVLKAYVDASGKIGSADPVIAVAGYVGNENTWTEFEWKWQEALDFLTDREVGKPGELVFSGSYFWSRERVYAKLSDADHLQAQSLIQRAIVSSGLIGLAATISCEAFEEWLQTNSWPYYPEDPYYFCLDKVLYFLSNAVREASKDEGVIIYCDQEHEHHDIGKELLAWHRRLVRRSPRHLNPDRVMEIHFGSHMMRKPLQAADLLSNAAFRFHTHAPDSDSQKEIAEFLSNLRMSTRIHFDNPELMDADLEARLRGGINKRNPQFKTRRF